MIQERLPPDQMLGLIQWHIDRYDRLRASTSSRAAVLLSANTLLLAGLALITNFHVNTRRQLAAVWSLLLLFPLIFTLGLVLLSMWACIGAIASTRKRKTNRNTLKASLPNRFVFNWSDTVKTTVDHQGFAAKLLGSDYDDVLTAATAELWTDVRQHSQRHKHLRRGVAFFQICVLSFFLLAMLILIADWPAP